MKSKWFAYLGILIIPVLLIYSQWRRIQLNTDPRYTITTTVRQIRTLKNGLKIEHYYFVNNKIHNQRYSKDERLNILYPNGKYLVRFSFSHPNISEVLWDKPVPDSIVKSPIDGWRELPF